MFKGLEKVNWTKLSHDVFRAPSCAVILSTLIGIGTQCIAITLTIIIMFSIGNFLSADERDYIYMSTYCISACYGFIGGYVSARLFKFFNGT